MILVDYTSNYPTAAVLLEVWQLMIAEKLRIRDVTQEAQVILDSVTAERLRDQDFWAKFDFIAEVLPDGQIFPVRTEYADPDGDATNN